ncbi:hypothetical protein [Nocardia sp. NPDC052566]|uniref:hypothetical protein n=1 Tax=Nocardia sp. NPDC052566 TaxID=3364330 RepID=UPI0037C7D4A1
MDKQQEMDLDQLVPGEMVRVTIKVPSHSCPTWDYYGNFARVDRAAGTLTLLFGHMKEIYRRSVDQAFQEDEWVVEKRSYDFWEIVSWQKLYEPPQDPPPPPPPVDLPVFHGTQEDVLRYAPDPAGLQDGNYPHARFANVYWAAVAQSYLYLRDRCPTGFIFDIDSGAATLPQEGRTEAPEIYEGYFRSGLVGEI